MAWFWRRASKKAKPVSPDFVIDGVPCEVRELWAGDRDNDKAPWVRLRAPFESSFKFRISSETEVDRFFKRLGFAVELQCGDAQFDEAIYIECDHPAFAAALQNSAVARALARSFIEQGFTAVSADGTALCAETKKLGKAAVSDLAPQLVSLKHALAEIEHGVASGPGEPFVRRTVAIETVIWSILIYGCASLFPLSPQHLETFAVIERGLILAATLFVPLLAAIFVLMRGSSRVHRIFFEGLILLLIGLPLAGYNTISDINTLLDSAPSEEHRYEITSLQEKTRRDSNGLRKHRYYAHITPTPISVPDQPRVNPSRVSPSIRVNKDLFSRVKAGDTLYLRLKPGRLGLPWIEEVGWIKRRGEDKPAGSHPGWDEER